MVVRGGDGGSSDGELRALLWRKLNDPAALEELSTDQLRRLTEILGAELDRVRGEGAADE